MLGDTEDVSLSGASSMVLVVENPPANAGDIETWVQFLGREDSPKEEMATHSNVLICRIPWTEEFGWLWSTGSQRVRDDLALMQACIASKAYI